MLLRTLHRTLTRCSSSRILQPLFLRSFSQGEGGGASIVGGDEPSDSLCSRVERLGRGESVVSAFQSWMGQGFAIHRGDVFHAINRLRKLKRNKRALEVSREKKSSFLGFLVEIWHLFVHYFLNFFHFGFAHWN